MSDTSDLGQSAKRHATELGAQAKAAATQEAVAHADNVKDTAASKVQAAADAAEAAAREFDPSSAQAQAVHQVAGHIEDVAHKLRHADVRDLAGQATAMARQNPLLFVGGAAIAGFAVARFLKAREPRKTVHHHDSADPWSPRTERIDNRTFEARINGDRTYD